MADLNRRNFLFGTVAAAASGTALVLAAPEKALRLFQPTVEETITLTRLPAQRSGGVFPIVGDTLYNSNGMPVLMVREVSIEGPLDGMIEITAFGDVSSEFTTAMMRRPHAMTARGYPLFGGPAPQENRSLRRRRSIA